MIFFLFQDPGFFLEVEFMQAELIVKSLGNTQEHYTSNIVEVTSFDMSCPDILLPFYYRL